MTIHCGRAGSAAAVGVLVCGLRTVAARFEMRLIKKIVEQILFYAKFLKIA